MKFSKHLESTSWIIKSRLCMTHLYVESKNPCHDGALFPEMLKSNLITFLALLKAVVLVQLAELKKPIFK